MMRSAMCFLVSVIIFISGCAARRDPVTCETAILEKKTILGDFEEQKICKCSCPPGVKPTVIDAGGILGGLLSLFGKD